MYLFGQRKPKERNYAPYRFADLLHDACDGHALWNPRLADDGGGNVGDIGYVDPGRGVFHKYGNIYDQSFLPGLFLRPGNIEKSLEPNSKIFKSANAQVLRVDTAEFVDSFPPDCNLHDVEVYLENTTTGSAFFAFSGDMHIVESLTPDAEERLRRFILQPRNYCAFNDRHGPFVVLTRTVKASGWRGVVERQLPTSRSRQQQLAAYFKKRHLPYGRRTSVWWPPDHTRSVQVPPGNHSCQWTAIISYFGPSWI